MPDVFVSYASQDRERVAPLVEAIERRGWSVWWDRKIEIGAAFDREIEAAIDAARCVVVVWSKHSVESDWVRTEALEGQSRGILAPVAIDAVRPPLAFRRAQTIDLTAAEASLEPLIDAVREHCPLAARTARHRSPLIARDAELSRLSRLLDSARQGVGTVALLSGEAGVGKTRLIQETEALAREAGMLTLWGRCVLAEGVAPYQPLVEQIEQAARLVPAPALRAALGQNAPELSRLAPNLRQLFPDIPEPVALPPDQERLRLLHGCADFLDRASRVQPLLLIFEDLHWAEQSTCRLVTRLAERLRNSSVMILGAYRDDELEADQPFFAALGELTRERRLEDIAVRRLAAEDVAGLLEGCAGQSPPAALVSLVFSETEGNPFFVEELYRHLEESGKLFADDGRLRGDVAVADTEVPRGVRLVIEDRLSRVSDSCRRLLTAAAVAGRMVGFELLTRLGDLTPDQVLEAIEEAEAAVLLDDVSTGREPRYQFVHEQTRQTLLGALSLPRRQRLHLHVADAHEAGGDLAPGEVAFHLYRAGAFAPAERTLRSLVAAAERALSAAAAEDALKLLDMAAEVAPRGDLAARMKIQGLRGLGLRGAARIDDALAALGEGLKLGEGVEGFTDVLRQRGGLLVDLYRGQEAAVDLERLAQIARARSDLALELGAQSLLADAYYRISLDSPEGARLKAREAGERAIALARAAGDDRALTRALIVTSNFIDFWPDYARTAIRNLDEAREIAGRLGEEALILDEATMRLRNQMFTLEEVLPRAEATLKRLEALGDPLRLKEHIFWMILPARRAGEFERSVELADRAIELAARLDVPPVQYPTFKAFSELLLGRIDDAVASIAQEVTGEGHRFGAALQRFGRYLMLCFLGAVDRAVAETEPLMAEARALSRAWMVDFMVDELAMAAARVGRVDAVIPLLRRLSPEREPFGLAQAWLQYAGGDAQGALEKADRLGERYRKARLDETGAFAAELASLALLALRRWDDAAGRASEAIRFCENSGFRLLHWRLLALRAEARVARGETVAAAEDRRAASEILLEIAGRIAEPDLKAAFLSQPQAVAVLQA